MSNTARRPVRRLLLPFLVLLGSASIAHAQGALMPMSSQDRLVTFALGGGVSVPVSDAKDAFKNGFNGQGFVRFNLHQLPINPRIDFTFQSFDLKTKPVVTAGPVTPKGTGQVFAGVANVQLPLIKGPIQPYIVAGLGAYHLSTDVDGGSSSSQTQFGLNGGVGATVKVKTLSIYAEGRIDNLFTTSGPVGAKNVQLIPVTFGIMY